jgi:RNA polymerase sigma-70 factor (ECF subfamily)
MQTREQSEPRPTAETVRVLVDNHREFLAFLERRLHDRALAEDILQEAFVRGMPKLAELRDDESAVAWFYRVLRNAIVDHHRRKATANKKLQALASELDHPESAGETHDQVCQCVGRLATTLKPEYAEALKRIELDGVSVKDYATEAGISASNAAVRVFRARESLRKQVSRSCGTCAEHGCYECTCQPGSC